MFFDKSILNPTCWSDEDYESIITRLVAHGCEVLTSRDEYILLKEVKNTQFGTEVSNLGTTNETTNPINTRVSGGGGNSPFWNANINSATTCVVAQKPPPPNAKGANRFLAPLDIQKDDGLANEIPSFKDIQSDDLSLCIGFDTEFQNYVDENGATVYRDVLSLQMSVLIGDYIIRYFFCVKPMHQRVTNQGGSIPLKYCIADVLTDIKTCYCKDLPLVLKRDIEYKNFNNNTNGIDFKVMNDFFIPITFVCHSGKADFTVFRRSNYDIKLIPNIKEIQGGWMTTKSIQTKIEKDNKFNHYWLVKITVRDTMGLSPADNKSLKALGEVINMPKIELEKGLIDRMCEFAISNPIDYYEYAMNDADIVVSFCAEIFQRNHEIGLTLSSNAAKTMKKLIKEYFGVRNQKDFDRVYRGLEAIDEGLVIAPNESMKFLKSTRYVPVRDNPDAKLLSEFFEEAYTGGYNTCYAPGWYEKFTTDFDLKNAYPTAMATIYDIDWSKPVRDFPRGCVLTLDDIDSPLTPMVIVGDFDFPDDCYCPNIPVPVDGGMKIYPLHGRNVYMAGPDIYLALKLGARIKVFRGFVAEILMRDDKPSQCLGYAVKSLVVDRLKAQKLYKDIPLIGKTLKTMVNSCYGKTAQNVSPKTRYNAQKQKRESCEPSAVTSPYHASYITSLVRCILIASINQLHTMGYEVYSVTTDGFITDAPRDIVSNLEAFGFFEIFQNGRYELNGHKENSVDNNVWEAKHVNEKFLNITTRGNVATNEDGVLAHNSYTTGAEKDSLDDREIFIMHVLIRDGRLVCETRIWNEFSKIVEMKSDFKVIKCNRKIKMNFDYKRYPVIESAKDIDVHFECEDGSYVDATIANFDSRPFKDAEEFLKYRRVAQLEDCIKIVSDLKRVKVKAESEYRGYVGSNLDRKVLKSIIYGYRSGEYKIPQLDGLKQSDAVKLINSWDIAKFTLSDWKDYSKPNRRDKVLPYEDIADTLKYIQGLDVCC